MRENQQKGSFTLPGEAGYEELTLKLANMWGADVIRDSDGTALSEDILNSGYGIYSTICIIRDHNDWASENQDKLQQTFLMSQPKVAVADTIVIDLMEGYFNEQFRINDGADSLKYWQVFDRTSNQEVSVNQWDYEDGEVTIKGVQPWHKYTVNFMVFRIWEEISMYNHTTNHWEKEHLMQIDPIYPATREYLLQWMKRWCEEHPATTVVRFTSMFYNFVWIWGSQERNRFLFTDWASYDFTVSPLALDLFAEKNGYKLTSEDFINQGNRHVTHMPGTKQKMDWMEFVNDFVISFGKQLIELVHSYHKLAYVFYDDSWVGVEPYGQRFQEFGFDGLIKCVFSGYELRLCEGVEVPTHELRLHPYLFPVGLGGSATFMEGGTPTLDAAKYWVNIRRALLRVPVDRIGLGGYLHLAEPFPDFCEYIQKISDEFRVIKGLHKEGKPYRLKPVVAVLHSWGKLRSWSLSGHFHETYMHDLIHINEALSGLPVDVKFISFEEIKKGVLEHVDVVINAGYAGSAWSGADAWRDDEIVEKLTQWVYEGGAFIGVNEPSAVSGYDTYFRMAHVLGVDEDTGAKVCHGKWNFEIESVEGILPEGSFVRTRSNRYLTNQKTRVLAAVENELALTVNAFGEGKGIYLSTFEVNNQNTRMLLNLILFSVGEKLDQNFLTDNVNTECAYYPESHQLIIINNSNEPQITSINTEFGRKEIMIDAFDTVMVEMEESIYGERL